MPLLEPAYLILVLADEKRPVAVCARFLLQLGRPSLVRVLNLRQTLSRQLP